RGEAGPAHRLAAGDRRPGLGAVAPPGDEGPGDRGLRPADPRRRQRAGPRTARRGRGGEHAVRPAGQGGRGVAALAAGRRTGGPAVSLDRLDLLRSLDRLDLLRSLDRLDLLRSLDRLDLLR